MKLDHAQKQLQHHIEMERLIAQIANQFFNSDIQQFDAIIDSALKQIGQANKVDRISMLEFNTPKTSLKITHEWSAEGIPTITSLGMDHFDVVDFKGVQLEFNKDSILIIPDCTQIESSKLTSLSPITKKLKIQTLLAIPLVSQKHSFGLLFFQSIKNLKNWDENETDLTLLKMIGEIFAIVQERRASAHLFNSSFMNSPNMMVILRRADRAVLSVNPTLLRILGYTREEILDDSDESIVVFDDLDKRNQMMIQFEKDGYVKDYEINLKTKSGKLIYSHHTMEIIQYNGEMCILLTVQDISSMKLSDQSLRREKERFQLVLENIPVPIVISDKEDRNLYANPKFTEILGYTIEDIPDTESWVNFAYPDRAYQEIVKAKLPEVSSTITKPRINEVVCKDKSVKNIIIQDIAINNQEFISIFKDVTEKLQTEAHLEESQQRFRKIVEYFPFPIVATVRDDSQSIDQILEHTWTMVNPAFSKSFGYTLEDVISNEKWVELAYPDKKYRNQLIAEVTLPNYSKNEPRERRITCKNGDVKVCLLQDIEIGLEEITIFQEITEKKQIEAHLKESQERFQKIVEHFPFPIVVTTNDVMALYINHSFSRTFGYTLEEIPNNEAWLQLAYPDPKYQNQIRSELEHPDYSPSSPRERNITCKNGEVKIFVLREIKIGSEEITIFQEITAQREAEKVGREKDQINRDIVENARDLIFLIDRDISIKDINPAVSDVLGYSDEEMIGRSAYDFILPEFHALVRSNIMIKREHKKETSLYEIDLRKKDGGILNVELFSRLIYRDRGNNNEWFGILAICRDISIRKRISEEKFREIKIESIGLLAGGIAHDFNNILVSIVGNINLLQMESDNLTQEQKSILQDLEKGSLQARDLTKQLLTFSKGGVPVKKPESIEDVIRESAEFILRGSKAKCNFHFSPDLPPVDIDAGQINQVLNNLLINSSQAMPNGGIIHISAFLEMIISNSLIPVPPGPYVKVTIEDTGQGIPKSIQHNIFDPYFTTKKTGTGLGLTMSYSIITKHRGFITFSSVVGKGTTFFLYLPAVTKQVQAAPNSDSLEKGLVSSGKVLILDDEENIHTLLRRVFSRIGINMVSCYDGTEVLQKLRIAEQEGPFDLIFMDLTIPGGLGGREAVKLVRNAEYSDIKIIVMSGYSNDSVIANFHDYGFDDYLEKPFTIEQLQALLQKWIKNRK